MLQVRTRAELARPDRRLLAIGDMLAHAADAAARPGADPRDTADTLLAAAADCYGIAYGCDGALAVPAGLRVLARVASVLARAAGDDAATPLQLDSSTARRRYSTSKAGRHAAA